MIITVIVNDHYNALDLERGQLPIVKSTVPWINVHLQEPQCLAQEKMYL